MGLKFLLFSFLMVVLSMSKLNAQAWEWVKTSSGNIDELALSVSADSYGNVVQCGKFMSSINIQGTTVNSLSGSYNWFLARYNPDGTLQWAVNALAFGGTFRNIYAVTNDVSGNTIITGSFSDSALVGGTKIYTSGYEDIFLAKFSTTGSLIWVKTGGGAFVDRAYDVVTDNSGNIYVAGAYQCPATFGTITLSASSTNMDQFGMLLCYNSNGQIQYGKSLGSITGGKMTGVAYYNDNIFLGGYTNSLSGFQVCAAKYNVNGDSVWRKTFNFFDDGGWSVIRHIHVTANNDGVFMAGHYADSINFGNGKIYGGNTSSFIVGLNASGIAQWTENVGGRIADILNIESANDQIVIGGAFLDSVKIAGENIVGVFDQNTVYVNNTFVAGMNTDGSLAWSKTIVPYQDQLGIGNINTGGIAVSGTSVYVSSSFSDNIVLWPWYPASDGITDDILLAKIDVSANSVNDDQSGLFSINPNPARSFFTMENGGTDYAEYTMTNIYGQVLKSGSLNPGEKEQVDTDLSSGIYLVYFKTENNLFSRKIIIQ